MDIIAKYKNPLIVIAMLVVYAWVGKAMFADYISKSADVNAKKEAIANEKELMRRWESATFQYSTMSAKFFQKDPALFKRFVEDNARSCSVAINSLITSKTEEGLLMNVRLSIKTQASYKNLLRFVKLLEEKNISVTHMTITKKLGSTGLDEDFILNATILKE